MMKQIITNFKEEAENMKSLIQSDPEILYENRPNSKISHAVVGL